MRKPPTNEFPDPMDERRFHERFAGFEDVATSAIESFLASAPRLLTEIERTLATQDCGAAEIAAHAAKGAAMNFFATPFCEVAGRIELAAKQRDLATAQAELAHLRSEEKRLVERLRALLKTAGRAA